MTKQFVSVLVLLASLALPVLAVHTVVFPIEELARRAALVVRAKVMAKSCQRDAQGRIYTKVELELLEVWKGKAAGARLTVVHSGGTLGERRAFVPEQVDFAPDEEVVAFLVFNQRGEAVILSLDQGKFTVWRDSQDGSSYAVNRYHGTGPRTRESALLQAVSDQPRLSVSELQRRVTGGKQSPTSGKAGGVN